MRVHQGEIEVRAGGKTYVGHDEVVLEPAMTHRWRVRKILPDRLAQSCRILVRGRMNSILVEFADGYRVVTSRNFVRRLP